MGILNRAESAINKELCEIKKRWCLEGYFLVSGHPIRIVLSDLPLLIGRGHSATVSVNQPSISRIHAEVISQDGVLAIRDCDSRNGTFVNHQRITGPTPLSYGDFVHLGSCEFRVVLENETLDELRHADETWIIKEPGSREFQGLMSDQAVCAKFQPVVLLDSETIFAFESLGRGNYPGAPSRPDELFRMAKRYGYSQALSNMFRIHALKCAENLPGCYQIFVNIHPDEFNEPEGFLDEMTQVKDLYPRLNLIVEIPESLIVDTHIVSDVRAGLRELGYGIAYDDFGKGQSRLMQLADCPPDYLKFDRTLIANIESAPARRQKMVGMLVDFANDMGVVTVAEGIETPGESETCKQLGFKCGQGYLFGRPMNPEQAIAI